MKHKKRIGSAVIIAASALLSACGTTDFKESLGITHNAPDEFQVFQRPPLTVPPEFNLRPPGTGPEYSAGRPSDQVAHDKVLGVGAPATLTPGGGTAPATSTTTASVSDAPAANSPFVVSAPTASTSASVTPVTANTLPSNADSQFLNDVGASKADPLIRQKITDDKNTVVGKDSRYLIDPKPSGDPLVDPTKEADRLKQDKAQNQPPTTGDTPVIVPEDKGLLGNIF